MTNRTNLHVRLRSVAMIMLVVALLGGAFWTLRMARHAAGLAFDQALQAAAADVALGMRWEDGQWRFELPPETLSSILSDPSDQVFFVVRDGGGVRVAGNSDLPLPASLQHMSSGTLLKSVRRSLDGLPIRVLGIEFRRDRRSFSVTVAETLNKRREMEREILVGMGVPVGAVLALGAFLAWVAVGAGLKPLDTLESNLARRNPDDLSPIPLASIPDEVSPLVATLNRLFRRIDDNRHSQQRFIADAAHQLRTPLARILSQLEVEMLRGGPMDPDRVSELHDSVRAASRTVNQLLSLARAEHDAVPLSFDPVDLAQLVRLRADDWVERAIDGQIDLGFELAPAQAKGSAPLLGELIENLVDNALEYAGSGATVNVSTGTEEGETPFVLVEDSGPGIAPEDRDRALLRFERLGRTHSVRGEPSSRGSTRQGTGLGLSIVREIADRHGATLKLDRAAAGGLAVKVVLAPP